MKITDSYSHAQALNSKLAAWNSFSESPEVNVGVSIYIGEEGF